MPQAAYLVFGFSEPAQPLDLGGFGLWNCYGYLDPFVVLPMNIAGTVAVHELAIPNDPSIVGLEYFNQGLIQDNGAPNPLKFVASNPAKGVVGM